MSENRCKRCNRKLKDPKAQYGWWCAQMLGIDKPKEELEAAFYEALNERLAKGYPIDADKLDAVQWLLFDAHKNFFLDEFYHSSLMHSIRAADYLADEDQYDDKQHMIDSWISSLIYWLIPPAKAESDSIPQDDTPEPESNFEDAIATSDFVFGEARVLDEYIDLTAKSTIDSVLLQGDYSQLESVWDYMVDNDGQLDAYNQQHFDVAKKKMSTGKRLTNGEKYAILLELNRDVLGISATEPSKDILGHVPTKEECPPLDKLSGLIYALRHQENPNEVVYKNYDDPSYKKSSDCTNFVSQILRQMGMPMIKDEWWFKSKKLPSNKGSSPSWRGADSLYSFLDKDKNPYIEKRTIIYANGKEEDYKYKIMDVVFINYNTEYSSMQDHVMVVTGLDQKGRPTFSQRGSDHASTTLDDILERQNGATGSKVISEMQVVRLTNLGEPSERTFSFIPRETEAISEPSEDWFLF